MKKLQTLSVIEQLLYRGRKFDKYCFNKKLFLTKYKTFIRRSLQNSSDAKKLTCKNDFWIGTEIKTFSEQGVGATYLVL